MENLVRDGRENVVLPKKKHYVETKKNIKFNPYFIFLNHIQ